MEVLLSRRIVVSRLVFIWLNMIQVIRLEVEKVLGFYRIELRKKMVAAANSYYIETPELRLIRFYFSFATPRTLLKPIGTHIFCLHHGKVNKISWNIYHVGCNAFKYDLVYSQSSTAIYPSHHFAPQSILKWLRSGNLYRWCSQLCGTVSNVFRQP